MNNLPPGCTPADVDPYDEARERACEELYEAGWACELEPAELMTVWRIGLAAYLEARRRGMATPQELAEARDTQCFLQ